MSDEYRAKFFNRILTSLAGKSPAARIEIALAVLEAHEAYIREKWCSHGNGD